MTWEDAVDLRGVSVESVMKSSTGRTKQRLRMFIENNCRFLKQLVALATKSHACLDRTDGVDSSDVVGLLPTAMLLLVLVESTGLLPTIGRFVAWMPVFLLGRSPHGRVRVS